jgi:hypothetical protein
MTMQLSMKMTLGKSTKGKHIYENADAAITSVYIKKDCLPIPPPKEITITVDI